MDGKKRKVLPVTAAAFAALMLLAGCGDGVYALPDSAPELETRVFTNEKDKEDGEYRTIICGGREYICYGTMTGTMYDRDVSACVGYTNGDKKERVCTLKATDDYIMETYIDGFMEQPVYYRAADTIGKDIYTPGYIGSLGYGLWEEDSEG